MDRFHDFDNLKQSLSVYGGSCVKFPAKIDNDKYMVKYPSAGNSNEAFSEYIASHIYSLLGIPSQLTILGKREGNIVVACKSFLEINKGERLFEANLILKNVYSDPKTYEKQKKRTALVNYLYLASAKGEASSFFYVRGPLPYLKLSIEVRHPPPLEYSCVPHKSR